MPKKPARRCRFTSPKTRRSAALRARETEEEYQHRLQDARERMAARRREESPTSRAIRLQKDAARTAASRAAKRRREAKAAAAAARAAKSPKVKFTRRQRKTLKPEVVRDEEPLQTEATKDASYFSSRSVFYMMDCNYKRALEDAQISTKMDPASAKSHLQEGKCYIALGDPTAALLSLKKAEELDPVGHGAIAEIENARTLIEYEKRAGEFMERRDFTQIVVCMVCALKISPGCVAYKLKKAECLAFLGRYEETQSIATEVLKNDPKNADAMYVRALCLYYNDNIDKAIKLFNQSLKLMPNLMKSTVALEKAKLLATKVAEGNTAGEMGKHQEALEIYTEALEIDVSNKKTNANLHYNKALIESTVGMRKEAIADCTKAIELDEKFLKAFLKRAELYMVEEDFEQAVRDYKSLYQMKRTRDHKHMLDQAERHLKMSQTKDYYKILGVDKNASEAQLKKAYKRRALLHHPDRHSNDSPEAQKREEKKFKEVSEAFAVLVERWKRHQL